jgi:hypothetical protein
MSVEIVYPSNPAPAVLRGRDVPIGTYFTGTVGLTDTGLFLRISGRIINLERPKTQVWSMAEDIDRGPSITDYHPVDLTILIKTGAVA